MARTLCVDNCSNVHAEREIYNGLVIATIKNDFEKCYCCNKLYF